MSTISVALAERLASAHQAARQRFVAAPVFGRPEAAAAGKLFTVAAGEPKTVQACQPLFKALGQHTFVIADEPPKANLVKLSDNFLIAVIETLGEAFALLSRHSPWTVEALDGGFKIVDANGQSLAYVRGHADPRDAAR